MRFRVFLGILLLSTCAPGVARAGIVVVTDRAFFESILTGAVTEDFESLAVPASPPGFLSLPSPVTLGLVDYEAKFAVHQLFLDPTFNYGTGNLLFRENTGIGITASLPAGVNAVGADFGDSANGASANFTINGSITILGLALNLKPNLTFYGFIGTQGTQITSLNVLSSTDHSVMDNFTYATTTFTPEPSTFSLLGIGCLVLAGYTWMKRRSIQSFNFQHHRP